MALQQEMSRIVRGLDSRPTIDELVTNAQHNDYMKLKASWERKNGILLGSIRLRCHEVVADKIRLCDTAAEALTILTIRYKPRSFWDGSHAMHAIKNCKIDDFHSFQAFSDTFKFRVNRFNRIRPANKIDEDTQVLYFCLNLLPEYAKWVGTLSTQFELAGFTPPKNPTAPKMSFDELVKAAGRVYISPRERSKYPEIDPSHMRWD